MDTATITPEAAQAILQHLAQGGDVAATPAIAQVLTPQMAQAAAASPLSPGTLDAQALRGLGQSIIAPQPAAVPASAPAAPAAAAPMPEPAAAAPPIVQQMLRAGATPVQAATAILGTQQAQGQNLVSAGTQMMLSNKQQTADAADKTQAALVQQGKVDIDIAKKKQDVLGRATDELEGIQADQAAYQQARQKQMADLMSQMQTASADAARTAPHDFWAEKSTPAKIFAIIASAAGGMANGLSNQPGQPTPLDRVIQNDLERQRLDFAQKSQSANQAAGIYNDLIKATGSDLAANTALTNAALTKVKAQLDEAAASEPEGQAKANLLAASAKYAETIRNNTQAAAMQLLKQGVDETTDAGKTFSTLASGQAKNNADIAVARIGADAKVEAADKAAKGAAGSFIPSGVHVIPGQEALVERGIPKQFQKEVYHTTTGYNSLKYEINTIEQIWNSAEPDADKVAEIAEHQATLQRTLSKVFNSGNRVSGGVYDSMTGKVPAGTVAKLREMLGQRLLFDANTLAALHETLDSARTYTNESLAPFGYTVDEPKAGK